MARIDDMRERYEKFSQGDIPGATDMWADDFVWQGPNSSEVPGSGEHQGKQAALEVLGQAVGAWDEYVLTADECFEQGGTVVVLGHTDIKKGDQSITAPVVHIWRFEGDQIKRFQFLTDTLQGAKLLGVA